jgi:thioredoxin 1
LVLLLLFCCTSSIAAQAWKTFEQGSTGAIRKDKARLLFFTASWCAPCHRIQPVLEKICRQNRAVVDLVIVDYDEFPQVVEEFAVESLPTMILLDRAGKVCIRVNEASKEGLDALHSQIKRLPKPANQTSRQ